MKGCILLPRILQTVPRGYGPILRLRSARVRGGRDFNSLEKYAAGRIYL